MARAQITNRVRIAKSISSWQAGLFGSPPAPSPPGVLAPPVLLLDDPPLVVVRVDVVSAGASPVEVEVDEDVESVSGDCCSRQGPAMQIGSPSALISHVLPAV